MNTITSVPRLKGGNQFLMPSFIEPSERDLNPHVRERIRLEIDTIQSALIAHGYLFSKLHYRQVWRIGVAKSCWLLTYQFDPFRYLLMPYDQDIADIITNRLMNR